MKNQILSTAIMAVCAAASAQAASLNSIVTDTTTATTLYIGGASAQRGYIYEAITGAAGSAADGVAADKICASGNIYWWADKNGAGTAAGKNQDVFYCAKNGSNSGLANAKANLLVYKRSAGGSDYGVSPIINNSAIPFLNISDANCTAGAVTTPATGITIHPYLCNYADATASTVISATPNLGVSDVDPAQFIGNNVTPGGTFKAVTAAGLANLKIQTTSTVVFGEQVTMHLWNALQQAQVAIGTLPSTCTYGTHTEACTPSLTSSQIAALHNGAAFDWNLFTVGTLINPSTGLVYGLADWAAANLAADAPATTNVHVVRRANGSGTQTQHGIHFYNYPCDLTGSSAYLPANDAAQTEAANGFVIYEESSAGNVNAGLQALNQGLDTTAANAVLITKGYPSGSLHGSAGVRWAVGLNSLEQVTTSTGDFDFVKIDGVAPTLANVVTGKYHDWTENTFQYNTTVTPSTDVAALRDTIIAKVAHPVVLKWLNASLTHANGQAGAYLANPAVYASTSQTYLSSNPVNIYSLATFTAPVDNCRVPSIYNDGGTIVAAPYLGL
jgi:hypothetical protein